jgi:hypothetical protein
LVSEVVALGQTIRKAGSAAYNGKRLIKTKYPLVNIRKDNMVQALIELSDHDNRVINIVKGKFGLSNKSEAVQLIIAEYENNLMEPELRPEFIEKMIRRQKETPIKIKDFNKHFGLD